MKLLNSTKNPVADAAIIKALEKVQSIYSQPVLSAYITGSYANNYIVKTSDVDLFLVFANNPSKEEGALQEQIMNETESIEPPMDIGFYGLPRLLEAGEVEMGKYCLHIYGEPVHEKIPNPNLADYIYHFMHTGYRRMTLSRKQEPYTWPLAYPNPEGEYKGYDWRTTLLAGKELPSIKEIVVLTGWMATGLVAWRGSTFVPTKQQCPELFSKVIGGSVAKDFQEITDFCRTKLCYLLPEIEEDKKHLQELMPRVLGLENYFMAQYQEFLIENLKNGDPVRVLTSVIRLGLIHYPNSLSVEALKSFVPQNEKQEKALEKSLAELLS